MSPYLVILIIVAYFLVLISISYFTGKNANNDAFFLGNRKSPWYIVAFGMISASLSGVTFISVPGWVVDSNFSYMQMVLGYLLGYAVIANVLMPMYYRLNLTSIYTYLGQRFGIYSYKTGASFFLLSRIIGASFRLFLVANVLQITVFNTLNIPFWVTVVITIVLIWLYTFKGGIKTIIWTDSLQTIFMLAAVGVSTVLISKQLNLDFKGMVNTIVENKHSKIFYFDDFKGAYFFFKQFFAGAFIAVVMTGLDQDMMQKNLSCRNLKDAQKNMVSFSIVLVFVNLLFLALGALLYMYAESTGMQIPEKADQLFPMLALGGYLGLGVGVFFILGLIAAAYSSADSALTALTTSYSIDILEVDKKPEKNAVSIRRRVHIYMSIALIIIILIFKAIDNDSVIAQLFTAAGYTYGPLLGMYAFGLFTKLGVKDRFVPIVCILSPILSFVLDYWSADLFGGYEIGFEILIINGAITFLGLLILNSGRSNLSFK